MDKSTLNTEILNCIPNVKRAKVHIIRGIRKKIGILRRCKKEKEKEKKHKKAERLVQEIMTIKKLHFTEVMGFALRTTNVENILKTPANEKEHACAVLSKHCAIKDKVITIRKKFNDWQSDLLPLLDLFNNKCKKKKILNDTECEKKGENLADVTENNSSTERKDKGEIVSGKKKKKLKLKLKNKRRKEAENKNVTNNLEINKGQLNNKKIKSDFPDKIKRSNLHDDDKKVGSNSEKLSQKGFNANENKTKTEANKFEKKLEILGKTENKHIDKAHSQANKLPKKAEPKKLEISTSKNENSDNSFRESDDESDKEKVIDPFFVNKKILKPKILDDDDKSAKFEMNDETVFETDKFKWNSKNSLWNVEKNEVDSDKFSRQNQGKSNNHSKRTFPEEFLRQGADQLGKNNIHSKKILLEEELHPSWAAKKSVKHIIQPFQGKKIKFNDD